MRLQLRRKTDKKKMHYYIVPASAVQSNHEMCRLPEFADFLALFGGFLHVQLNGQRSQRGKKRKFINISNQSSVTDILSNIQSKFCPTILFSIHYLYMYYVEKLLILTFVDFGKAWEIQHVSGR